jgi:adenine C2-methylase RlmN of 23S rRNA A2503 and tRNA A37
MKLQSNLSSAQILEQVWIARNSLGSPEELRNVVFMGMGEPLDNFSAVHEACRGLTHQCLFGLSGKHITISTVGASPKHIVHLADEAPGVNLALSLHGATQELRENLIPSAKLHNLSDLAKALDYYTNKTAKGVMLEYILISGMNDTEEAADALASFCSARQRKTFVNLIPYNPTIAGNRFGYKTPSDDVVKRFHETQRSKGIHSSVRWSTVAGRDAQGACGQLALSLNETLSAPA